MRMPFFALRGASDSDGRATGLLAGHITTSDDGTTRRSLSRMSAMSTPVSFRLRSSAARVATAAIVTLTLAACGGGKAENAPAAAARDSSVVVLGAEDVAVAREAEIGTTIQLSGALRPKDVAVLRAQVAGTVTDLRVDNGARVQAGQRLLSIRAAGVVSQAAGAKASVAAAEANLAVARKQLEAAQALAAAGAMSVIERQSAEASFQAAQAQLAAARAQATSAEEVAGHTSVVAPFAGVVSNRRRQNGEPVAMNDELLTVVDSRVLELPGQIGVADAGRVRPGQRVQFTLDAFAGETFDGRVARMDPVADAGTRQVGVYVELRNPAGRIVGGQFARGRIDLGASRSVVVPITAVVDAAADGTGGSVFVIVDGKLVRRQVVVGSRDDAAGVIAIRSGVAAGEQVLRTPTGTLREGAPARVLPADGGAASTPATAPAAAPASAPTPKDSASASKE
ncbi:efflux RND transporter periplasmic adaptor subunit [Gemmatimonas aurantiaca]|uniref:efflux RND transporter periplasmic adaptor subunit n=1 Tax=Gemmatimonas aurantiaca TaxID=173480 RepID=UPI00301D7B24